MRGGGSCIAKEPAAAPNFYAPLRATLLKADDLLRSPGQEIWAHGPPECLQAGLKRPRFGLDIASTGRFLASPDIQLHLRLIQLPGIAGMPDGRGRVSGRVDAEPGGKSFGVMHVFVELALHAGPAMGSSLLEVRLGPRATFGPCWWLCLFVRRRGTSKRNACGGVLVPRWPTRPPNSKSHHEESRKLS